MKYTMKKLMTACLAAAALFLASCGSTVDNSVIKAFINAKASDVTYAYAINSGSRQTLSDYAAVTDDDEAASETMSDLQEALQEAKLTETDKELSQTDLLYVFRLSDNSILYLYSDGSIKTVDAKMNRKMYTGDETMKEVGEDAAEHLADQLDAESDD